jgi:hypothetical protein
MSARTDLASDRPIPPAEKLALAYEVATSYAAARRALKRDGLRPALASLRTAAGDGRMHGDDVVAGGRRLGRVVRRTLAVLPGDTRCLTQSLVLTRMLARRGVESRLVIGVKAGESFAAHAWVEYDGAPLLPPGTEGFEELVTL